MSNFDDLAALASDVMDEVDTLRAELAEALADKDRAVEAILQYGVHAINCIYGGVNHRVDAKLSDCDCWIGRALGTAVSGEEPNG